jgi:hypothetical protein
VAATSLELGYCGGRHCLDREDESKGRNLVPLALEMPPEYWGSGFCWWCPDCCMPPRGAVAVLCDTCLKRYEALPSGDDPGLVVKEVVAGHEDWNRLLIVYLFPRTPYEHDASIAHSYPGWSL